MSPIKDRNHAIVCPWPLQKLAKNHDFKFKLQICIALSPLNNNIYFTSSIGKSFVNSQKNKIIVIHFF